ncbi:hypothetical protein FRC04_006439 [Tulasnella sp. 424]|nr:hypothetical protein FRC04_006439 [Tulasnella sp. 424]
MPPKDQRVCEQFRRGQCSYGKKCKFSHTNPAGNSSSHGKSSSTPNGRRAAVPNNQGNKFIADLPKGACRTFWETGRCNRGYECKYRHDQKLAPAATPSAAVTASVSTTPLDEGLVDRYVDAFSDGFSPFTLTPNVVHNQIKPFIKDESRFRTNQEMYQFAAMLGSANMYNDSWDIENGQEFFSVIADPNGEAIHRIQDILFHESVSSHDIQAHDLSFQKAYLPVLGYLSSRWVVRSTLRKNVNALYGLLDHSFDEVDRVLQSCIEACMAAASFSDGAMAVSGLQVFRVVSKCLYEYATRFKNAVAQHPCFATLVTKLVEWSNTWAIAVCASPPSFQDPIAGWSSSGKAFAVDRMKKSIDSLFEVVERAEGSTLRRSDLGRDAINRESNSQALLDGLQMTYDGPGSLHEGGAPRHDNDLEDVSKIQVVPTHAELTCPVGPYLPANIPGARHHLPGSSMERLIDVQFRLLREELIAPIRSSLSHVLHDWEQPSKPKTQLDVILAKSGGLYKSNSSGWDSVMFSIYTGVRFKSMECDVRRGLAVELTFDTPQGRAQDDSPAKRAIYWESVGKRRLMQGGLLGLLWIPPNSNTQGIRFYLGTVTSNLDDLRRSAKLSADRLSVKVSFFDAEVDIRILNALQQRRPSDEGTKLLIEAPIMFESIRPFLDTLKSRPPASIPFSRYIAHHDSGDLSSVTIDPPAYVTPQFAFKLDSLFDCKPPIKLSLRPHDELSVQNAREMLRAKSRLDPSQADAMVNVLTSEVSLIQGPPGTGKSFTGVELLRVLISNGIRPILLIAFTNHALDNIITHVLDKGLTKNVIRLGSRSNDETVAQYTLDTIMRTRPQTQADKSAGREYGKMMDTKEKMSALMAKVVAVRPDEEDIRNHLQHSYPRQFSSLFSPPLWIEQHYEESKDWKTASKKGSKQLTRVEFWTGGKDISFIKPPPADASGSDLQGARGTQNARMKSRPRYDALRDENDDDDTVDDAPSEAQDWLTLMTAHFAQLNLNSIPQIPVTNRPLDQLLKVNDVWSMSTSERQRLHTHWVNEVRELARDPQKAEFDRLKARHSEARTAWSDIKDQSVAPKVLLVEEAGQVLEAHILASLVPSIEHLILIGDPLQLRPTIENYQLSMDNPRTGKIFRFDQSLMERLSSMGLHMSQLDVQRRMRPQIADLVRHTLYPALKDHTLVQTPPSVRGMAKDVFFLDHRNAEESGGDDSASKTNTYEAKMIKDLVLYFLKQGKYTKTGDIVVLCAYLGQLAKVRKFLASEVATVIDERDAVQLINHEDNADAAEILTDSTEQVQVAKRVLLRTVDNFQGEEGTIVILSLVRNSGEGSTGGKKIGFLKSTNRANVALSRAREGLYILGNADDLLASGSAMWSGVIDQLRRNEQIGPAFPLSCSRHPGTAIEVSKPGQIAIHAPDGGCLEDCNSRLNIELFAAWAPASNSAREDTHAASLAQLLADCAITLPISGSRVVTWARYSAIKLIIPKTFAVLSSYRSPSQDAGIRDLWPAQMMPRAYSAKCRAVALWLAVAVFARTTALESVPRITIARTFHAKTNVDRVANTIIVLFRARCLVLLVWIPASGSVNIKAHVLWCAERHVHASHVTCVASSTWHAGIAAHQICPLCANEAAQNQVVDVIMGKQLCEIDPHGEELDELIITLTCGHVFTVETLDGICELEKYYTRQDDAWTSLAPPPQGLQRPPTCPHCREPIKSLRYGRVYKRADLDMSEQRIAEFDDAKFCKDLEKDLAKVPATELPVGGGEAEQELDAREKKTIRSNESLPVPSKRFDKKSHHLVGTPKVIKDAWIKATRRLIGYYDDASKVAATTSSHVRAYEAAVATLHRQYLSELKDSDYVPATITHADMALGLARKACGLPAPPKADVRFRVEACWLTFNIRFHMVTLAQKVAEILVKAKVAEKVRSRWADMIEDIIYSIERDASMAIDLAQKSQSNRQVVRTVLFLMEAQYQASSHRVDRYLIPGRLENLKKEVRDGCAKAKVTMDQYGRLFREAMDFRLPDQQWLKDNYGTPAEAIVAKWAALITRLDGSYTPITEAEKREIVKALMGGFLGIKCNSVIGGSSHTLNPSNTRAMDLENIGREEGMVESPFAWGRGA